MNPFFLHFKAYWRMEFSLNQMKLNKSPKSTVCTEKGPLLTWKMSHLGSWYGGSSPMSDPLVLGEE